MTGLEGGRIMVGSGDVRLKFAKKPSQGLLDLKAGSGDVSVLFPKGSKIKSQFHAGSGELKNEIGDSPDASFQVVMKAGSGNLEIKSY